MIITVIDFEAAGTESYPIEFGWAEAHLETGEIRSDSFLIRPTNEWLENWPWEEEAEQLHRISQVQLGKEGIDVMDAVERVSTELAGRTLYSDAPGYETRWMQRLYEAGNTRRLRQPVDIQNVANAFNLFPFDAQLLREKLMEHQAEERKREHRAREDSMEWAKMILSVYTGPRLEPGL